MDRHHVQSGPGHFLKETALAFGCALLLATGGLAAVGLVVGLEALFG